MKRKWLSFAFAQTLSLLFIPFLFAGLSLNAPPSQPAAPLVADLQITKTASPDPVLLGDRLTYSIVVNNLGNTKASSVVMTDTLPASVTFASVSTSKGACTQTGTTVRCTLGNINKNLTVRVTIAVTPTLTGVITNTAVIASPSDTNPANNTTIVTTTVNPKIDLTISKTDAPDPVLAGETLAYTLVVTNVGTSSAANVTVTDTLPLNVAFGSASPGCAYSGAANHIVTCAIGGLAGGGSQTRVITVTPDVNAAGSIVNTAVVGSSDSDAETSNNTATAITTVRPKADLAVNKTSAPAPAFLGNPLTYTIVLTNNGPSAATGVVLTDTLPAGVTFSSASPGCSHAGGIVTCSIAALTGGETVSSTIRVIPNVTGLITNTVTARAVEFDPNTANNTRSATTTVIPAADVSVVKTANANFVLVGDVVTYTIGVTNLGPSNAANVLLTDTLPLSVTFGSVTSSRGTCSGTSLITCSLGAFNAGASATITVVVTTTAIDTIVNTAVATSSVADPNLANNAAALPIAVNPVDLSVSKTASSSLLTAGNPLTYTLVVTNNGPLNGTGVQLTDTLPANVALVSVTSSQGTCSGTSTISCALGSLNVDAVATVTVVVNTTTTGNAVNTVVVGADQPDPNPLDNTAQATTAINPADLAVSKTAAPGTVYVGNPLTYTLVVTNHGPANATGVIVTDTLPTPVTFGSASAGCVLSSRRVICSIGALSSGSSRTITITVTPGVAAVGIITNTAVVAGAQPDSDPADNVANAATTVQPKADLVIDKTDGPDPLTMGDSLIYVLTVVNNGPSTATNVVVTDTLPAGSTVNSTSPGCTQAGGVVTCPAGTLPTGAILSILIETTPSPAAAGLITNTASVTASEYDPSTANNTASASTTVIPVANLAVSKTATPNPGQSGSPLIYRVVVTNTGPSHAPGVVLTDTLPAGVTFNSASPGCTQAGGVVTCALGQLATGVNRTIAITVTPQASTSGTYIANTVQVASSVLDPDPANNSFLLETAIDPVDLSVVKRDAPDPAIVGNPMTYTLVVSNSGPSNATGVTLLDTLPPGVSFRAASAGCSQAGGLVTCDLADLAVGSGKTVTIFVTPTLAGLITNTAIVDANESDNNPANDTASATTTVVRVYRVLLPIVLRN